MGRRGLLLLVMASLLGAIMVGTAVVPRILVQTASVGATLIVRTLARMTKGVREYTTMASRSPIMKSRVEFFISWFEKTRALHLVI